MIFPLFTACSLFSTTPDGPDPDGATPTDDPCPTVLAARPEDDADDVYFGASLEWDFDAVDPTVTTRMQDINGNPIGGAGAWQETTWIWTPDEPLEPDSPYGVELTACDGGLVVDSSFTTSAVGLPVSNPPDLVGNTYVFDFTDPTLEVVRGVPLDQTGYPALLLQVSSVDPLLLRIGATHEDAPDVQDTCFPTADLDGTLSNPFLEAGPGTIPIPSPGTPFRFLTVEGVVAPSMDTLVDVHVLYAADARDQTLFPPEDLCASSASFGEGCVDCPDGSGAWCVFSEFVLPVAPLDATLQVVDATVCE